MNRRDLLTSAGAGLSLAAIPQLARAGTPRLYRPERYVVPQWTRRVIADAALSAKMDAVGLAAVSDEGILTQSRSMSPLYEPPLPYMEQGPGNGCNDPNGCSMNNGWTDPDGSAISGWTQYANQSEGGDPPTIVTVLVSGSDYGYYPTMGQFSTGYYYPQIPPKWVKPSACGVALLGEVRAAANQLISFFRTSWSKMGNFGKLVENFIRLYGPVANSEPWAFIEGIMAIGGAPEVTAVLLIMAISLGAYLVWKGCFSR